LQSVQQYNPLEVAKAKYIATYPFNSLIGTIVQNAYTHLGHAQIKGYEPLNGSISSKNLDKQIFTDSNLMNEIDTSSIRLLKETLILCKQKNIKVVLCFSPFYFYKPARPLIAETFNQLASDLQVPIYNYTTNSHYYKHPELFYDELHLNQQGAILFSKEVASRF
jgi:lysophospholipase L1-like esterase